MLGVMGGARATPFANLRFFVARARCGFALVEHALQQHDAIALQLHVCFAVAAAVDSHGGDEKQRQHERDECRAAADRGRFSRCRAQLHFGRSISRTTSTASSTAALAAAAWTSTVDVVRLICRVYRAPVLPRIAGKAGTQSALPFSSSP